VVGQRTAGAAHTYEVFPLGEFQVAIPTGRPVSPVTGSNWEGRGVEPDREVPAEEALDVAHRLALESLLARASDQAAKARLEAALRTLTASSGAP
jgi:C-terminal processing protease CtpA/Prc